MEMETCEAAERLREEVPTSSDLISFDAEEPAASQTLVCTVQTADVSPRLTQVPYDDFSVKPEDGEPGRDVPQHRLHQEKLLLLLTTVYSQNQSPVVLDPKNHVEIRCLCMI